MHRVAAERDDGATATYLPAPIADTDVHGFAYPFDPADVTSLTAYDVDGNELATLDGDQLTPGS